MSAALQAAHAYVARKWNPLPLPFKSKVPPDTSWQKRVIREADLPQYFNGKPQNVGVVLGPSSHGLTDLDLDCLEAIELASHVLPKTGAIFGRASAPGSHRLYYSKLASTSEGEAAVIQFKDPARPAKQAMLLELRVGGVKGAQTVFPGSVHESDEEIRWDENGDPATVDNDDLMKRARLLAAICLFARYWPGDGARHDAALSLGGFLARVGLKASDIKYLVEAIARAAGDAEHQDRKATAEDAAQAFHAGKPARGYPQLKKAFGEDVAKQVADWLDYRGTRNEARAILREAEGFDNGTITQDGVAQVFARRFEDQLRYCHHTGAWFEWTGTHWKKDQTALAFQFCRELGREFTSDSGQNELKEVRKITFAGGVEKFSRSDRSMAVTSEIWDCDPFLLGTPDGTVDLRTGKLREPDPADGITRITAVSAAATVDCPRWLQFLEETFGDAELIGFIKQWCGYCLTGDINEHALVFGFGNGKNGKSVWLNVLVGIMGDYATTAAMETFTASKFDRHPTELAMLKGARLVTASETEEGRSWAESRIKQITGGDPITARFMQKDFFTFQPNFKLTIIGNHKPLLRNVDEAARRRFNLIPFNRTPANIDPLLGQKLRTEWSGILRWMIEGCLDWQQCGLLRPESVIAATESYFEDQDMMGQWLAEECDAEPGNRWKWEATAKLFESWTEFSNGAGEGPGSRKTFTMELARRGFEAFRFGRANIRSFRGLRLKPQPSDKRCPDDD